MAEKKRETRYRDFTCVIYEDSVNENWLEILKDSHLQILISPWHDKDKNPDGSLKKKHRHIMIMYDSVRTKQNAIDFIKEFGGVGCEIVKTKRGMARYLTHLDNPEKYQYHKEDVIVLGGAEYYKLVESSSDKFQLIDEIIDYIDEYKIEDILELYQLARSESKYFDWLHIIQSNIYLFDKFCSANYKKRVFGKNAPERVQKVQIIN